MSQGAGSRGDPEASVEARLRTALTTQLREAIGEDAETARRLDAWAERTGVDGDGEAADRAAAREASVLATRARYRGLVGQSPPPSLRTTPVSPFAGRPTPDALAPVLDRLERATAADPAADAFDLGADYADALADEERRRRGQFYTPRPVAEPVVEWALGGGDGASSGAPPRVLDPAAGTGTFLLAAYDALRARHPEADPAAHLPRLVGVDVDGTALHLAGLRLSARAGGQPVEDVEHHARSFFDLEPGRDVAPVDAVVGNPPFVRAGALSPDRAHFRAHLDALGPDGEAPYAGGDRALSGRSDASVYFVTHATRFLGAGGRLGLVLPAKWLESEYGVGFRRFLADHYRIEAVVGFDARTFDALVDTVVLLAERRPTAGDADGDVRFVRVEDDVDAASLRRQLGGDRETRPRGRTVRRDHGTFATARQCSPYLRAPPALLDLLDHPDLVPLGDLAAVRRGVTTGANDWFLLDAADRQRWAVDDRFLGPAVRSMRGVETRAVEPGDVERAILDVHAFVTERVAEDAEDPTAAAKAALADAGQDGLLDYVAAAEAEGLHERRTCRSRRVWFDLGDLPAPDAFVPKLCRERVFTIRNRAAAVPTNAIDCLAVADDVDPAVLLGVLDSSLCRAVMEVWGRDEAGLLQLMTDETRTLPVPDVRALTAAERRAIRDAAEDLSADGTGQSALDAAVLDALDVDLEPDRIRAIRERLLRRRVEGGEGLDAPAST